MSISPFYIIAEINQSVNTIDINPVVLAVVALASAVMTAVVPFFFNRFKTAQEARKVGVDSESLIVETTRSVVGLVREQMSNLKQELDESNSKILRAQVTIDAMKKEMDSLGERVSMMLLEIEREKMMRMEAEKSATRLELILSALQSDMKREHLEDT